MKIKEMFEYEVDTDNVEEVFTINDYVKYVNDMPCPFWDGMKSPYIICHNLEIL